MGWMSDFHPFNKDLVADPSPKILVIADSCVAIKMLRSRGAFSHGASTGSLPHRLIENKNTATSGACVSRPRPRSGK